MPSNAEFYRQMAEKVTTQLTSSWQEWAGFLTTAARLYKYPFHEQLMIYAQRPDATACAEYDLWNKKMGRYVRRGSKGIALVDDSGDKLHLRYVFDISDTGTREHSRTPWLWKMEEPYQEPVSAMLERTYEVSGEDLAQQLEAVAHKLAGEYWTEHRQDFLYIVDDSFLEEYDEFNIEAQFKAAATVSITYALMSRCGLEPERYFSHEDFMAIFDFNTPATIGALGTAVSQINQQVLRQIGVTIRNYEHEAIQERSNQHEESYDLHPERRLSDSQPETERTAGEAPGQVRQDAESVSEGTPAHPLQPASDEREAVPAPHRDRRDHTEPSGTADAPAGSGSGRDGAAESQRPDEVGGPDEHLQGSGRGNPDGGTYQQLSFFLSENEQIRIIDEAENVKTSSAFSFAQADIDHVLRLGGNTDRQRERIVAAFEKQKSTAEIASTLKNLYHGGNGIGSVTAWYAEDGIRLSRGKSARYDKSAQTISWESAAERIGQLLQDGQFVSNVELTEAAGYERSLLAEKFWNLYHDFSDEARDSGYLACLSGIQRTGFPEETAWLAEQLNRPEFRQTLSEEYAAFWTAYQQDRDLLRFHYHKPREIWESLQDLSLPRRTFSSEMQDVPSVKQFITEDEIDAAMTRGSSFEGGKGRIFTFFQEPHTDKEKVNFLKHEYGIGGHSHALSGAGGSWEDHDGKGLRYKKAGCPDVHFTWEKAAKRITDLIQKGRYLTEQEQAQYDKIQAEKALAEENAIQAQQPDPVIWEYNGVKERHPDDLILYQMGDFFEIYGEDAKEAAAELDLNLTTRAIPGGGRVEMCGFPANRLEQAVEQLRDQHDVTISAVPEGGQERQEYSMTSVDHEAEQDINAHEAEFGADGTRVFQTAELAPAKPTLRELHEQYKPIVLDAVMEDVPYRNACGHSDHENAVIEGNAAIRRAVLGAGNMELLRLYSDMPEFRQRLHREVINESYPRLHEMLRPLSQDDIDDAICAWNGNLQSKHAVVRYMEQHGREKDTAAWLAHEYSGNDSKNLFVIRAGSPEGIELPWSKVQRRIAQLIKEDRFYTEAEQDRFDNIDPIAIREALAERGIVNGQLVDPEKLDSSPFIQRVMAEASEIAADETEAERTLSGEELQQKLDFLNSVKDQTSLPAYLSLNDEQRRIVDAIAAAGYMYDTYSPERQEIRFSDPDGTDYPVEFQTWEQAYEWIDSVQFRDDPELRDKVQAILHPGPVTQTDLEYARQNLIPGETTFALDGRTFQVSKLELDIGRVELQDVTFANATGFPIFRVEPISVIRQHLEQEPEPARPSFTTEPVAVYPGDKNHLPYDVAIQTLRTNEPEPEPSRQPAPENFRITDDNLGAGGPKEKFWRNIKAIATLKQIEQENRHATPEEQHLLSQYVGWGGLADAFDPEKPAWAAEYAQLKELLTPEEYAAARGSTLNAHYTSPTVIRAIYEAVGRMGFETGNILEPSCGVGNFFGMLPEEMRNSRLYGVELDTVSGRIAQQLYPKANITVAGFETTDRRDFYDLAVGNVPFGQYQVNDKAYNKLGFNIHNYFFAKALDQVRPGGVVAFVTSRYTMDAKDSAVRRYLAQRAELLGAIRLPNDAFKKNAGTEVVSDIIFLQKRDRPLDISPEWTQTGQTEDGFAINRYFLDHPEMVLGRPTAESTQYGKQDYTVIPIEGLELAEQLHDAVKYICGTYQEAELPELGEGEAIDTSIPADPNVKNYSYTVVDGAVYFRENSRMVRPELNATAEARVKGLVGLRDCVQELIDLEMDAATPDSAIREKQAELNRLYDNFSAKYGLINDRANRLAFSDDSSYYLLCALEVIDEDGRLERKADMFTKRTIQPHEAVTSVDTASEALAVSISEKACVDMAYMAELAGKSPEELAAELQGVIFRVPGQLEPDGTSRYVTADEYLSGNVRRKLRQAQRAAQQDPSFAVNVEALTAAQPKDLDASEIEVRLGATWIDKEYIQQFMYETFDTPFYMQRNIQVNYTPFTAEWQITGKNSVSENNVAAYTTYGTRRANAYKILEESLNLRDVRIYDTIEDPDGKERRVLNAKETTLAAQKQQAIRDAFRDWIWKDPERRQALVHQYNEEMNSTRPREYDGSHITFGGMNPAITLRDHQLGAIAHILYGGNTLLAHEVGAGKTFEMVAAAMEAKRLGLCQKSLFAVPNHLTEQWASEFLRLYPSANILVTTKKDFETHNRKKFCARIATGDYDAIIMGHSQFEKIPISRERQERLLYEQIDEITEGIAEVEASGGEHFTVKQLERTRKSLEARLEKLQAESRKDDVVTFEQLGVDRLFVDEAHSYKNLFLYTKMRNVAGLSTSDAQKSSDMFAKCRYMDELTGSRGVVFATGTPVSNSMTELYTMQRYLQYDRLQELNMTHFDCWASRFGETVTALELAPEGTGYRARTRFSKFFNLPELMNLFKEVADIKTADQLNLPTPEVEYHNIVAQPTEHQKEMVKVLSERASQVHDGSVDPRVDNMLKITGDGRKLGLDQRIINQLLPDEPGTKVNQCVDNIMQIWRDGDADKLTQLVFCDISTPQAAPPQKAAKQLDNPTLHALEDAIPLDKPEPAFTIYEDIRQKLIAQGMPANQIAFIHEANTEVRKKELFAKVRTGQVRVLLGSTSKMGAGTNVQDRLVALHDLDCPWRPGDLAQRKGRIERQGNKNPLVHVYRYVTEGTFDAYLWQTVENKQKFISQIMTSKSPVRSCDDVDETALSFAEIKALCAGDPRIKERMDLDVEVARLKLMKADHQSKQYRLEDQLLKYFPQEIENNKGYIKGFEKDLETLAAHPHPEDGFAGMEVRGDVLTDKENAGAALLDACKEVKDSEPVRIGSYRGFAMSVEFQAWKQEYTLLLKGEMTHRATLGTDPRGNLTRIDNALAQMPQRLEAVQNQLNNLYQQQAAAKEELSKPFLYEDDLQIKTARLVELDTLLNIGDKGHTAPETVMAKSARPSVLDSLKRPVPPRSPEKKPKQHEEVR
ncbi:MutS domain I protein [Clostridium sp. M62/1]|nr:MutS domain I protein [Clostridium sp. M62/1]